MDCIISRVHPHSEGDWRRIRYSSNANCLYASGGLETPPGGADFFELSRAVIGAVWNNAMQSDIIVRSCVHNSALNSLLGSRRAMWAKSKFKVDCSLLNPRYWCLYIVHCQHEVLLNLAEPSGWRRCRWKRSPLTSTAHAFLARMSIFVTWRRVLKAAWRDLERTHGCKRLEHIRLLRNAMIGGENKEVRSSQSEPGSQLAEVVL